MQGERTSKIFHLAKQEQTEVGEAGDLREHREHLLTLCCYTTHGACVISSLQSSAFPAGLLERCGTRAALEGIGQHHQMSWTCGHRVVCTLFPGGFDTK